MYVEIGLIIFGAALLLLVLFCIPILLKLWRAANDVTVTLQALNERLPMILKNMEEISANINHSTTAINDQVQKYADASGRVHVVVNDVVRGIELFAPLAIKSPLFRKMIGLIPVIKGVRVFLNVLTGKRKVQIHMARMTFSGKWGRVAVSKKPIAADVQKSAEDAVREMKIAARAEGGEDYREKSLSIHGLVCARCGRDFSGANRQLLTVHHKDGNHHHNPPDGSNWENLCVYCHEDVHSREVLAEYLGDGVSSREVNLIYGDPATASSESESILAQKLRQALQKKK